MSYNTLKCLYAFLLLLVYVSKIAECNVPSTLDMNKLPTVRVKLSTPPLSRVVEALLPGLSENFKTVTVVTVQCPDLTQPPFNLAAEGLSGSETIIEVGSPSYLASGNREKVYDLGDFKKITESDPLFVAGAAGGPWQFVGVTSSLIANVRFTKNNDDNNRSHIYKVSPETNSTVHVEPKNNTNFASLGNFFTSNGLGGEVLKIECETRKGPLDFASSIRNALAKYFGDEVVGLGGPILIENGKVKVHVMADFTKPQFYEASGPFVGLGFIVSRDPGLDLRTKHFHLFSENGSGGHYHNDTEPTNIKYTAYFNVAKNLIRIDQPKAATS